MARFQTKYTCQSCAYESPKWLGRCPECEAWDSFTEEVSLKEKGGGAGKEASKKQGFLPSHTAPVPITKVTAIAKTRRSTLIREFDRVLGGGIVPGGLILVGGDPGIGKSTLLTQVASNIANASAAEDAPVVLYISGEESAEQIKLRSARLGAESDNFLISVETEIHIILQQLDAVRPALAIIDSIQTMFDSDLDSAPGNVSQVRACTTHLARFAKSMNIPLVLIGHVTKEGSLAGPRVLEHIVDTVLNFEGDQHHAYRLLRAAKNRFGSTDELGIFEMYENGLIGVENPSAVLLSERLEGSSGSAVAPTIEGTRALLVEVQALVSRSPLASPRRSVTGMEPNRVNMILAVLEKRLGLKLAEQDVFVNVAGGIRILEPATDLAAALAIISNFREQPIDPSTVLLGEIGLAGEVRAVSQPEKRLREAARLGFKRAILSKHNLPKLAPNLGIQAVGVESVSDAFLQFFSPRNA